MNTVPFHLSIICLFPANIQVNKRILENMRTPISKLDLNLKGIGLIIALIPKIKKILKMFEPTMFPTAISVFFLYAAVADVANSGSDVPRATIVKPIKD